MKNRLLIIVNDNNTNIYEIIEQLSNMKKLVVPRKETTDESLAFYSSFFNMISASEFEKSVGDNQTIKSYSHTDKGLVGYKADSIGQGYADLYNGKGRVLVLCIEKEELPYYSHYYNGATYVGFIGLDKDIESYQELLDDIVINNDNALEQLNSIIEKIIEFNPYVYEKK